MLHDLRYAVLMLRRTPAFTAVALIALALGIGANTAIFTIVNAVLLQPLPYEHSEQLGVLRSKNPAVRAGEFPLSPPDFLDYRSQNHVFSLMSLVRSEPFLYAGAGGADRLPGTLVSPEFFDLLGAKPAIGRGFRAGDENAQLVVLSFGLWQRQFGEQRNILGNPIQLNGKLYTVIGVAPRGFDFPPRTALWTPFEFGPRQLRGRALRYAGVIARLYPGVPIERAQAELGAIAARLARQYPADNAGWEVIVRGLQEDTVGNVRPAMLTLAAAVGFVLLIACANVANLLLARSIARRREISVRAALGAGKARLIRQLLTESLLVALAGAGFGLWLAGVAIRILVQTSPNLLPRASEIHVNTPVLVFTVAMALLTGLLFGLAPALKLVRCDISAALRESTSSATVSFRRNRSGAILIIVEVALSVMLLAAAGLLMRSFSLLRSVDPGFRPDHLVVLRTTLPATRSLPSGQTYAFFESALARIRGLPGVMAAGASDTFPMTGGQTLVYVSIPGQPPKPGQQDTAAAYSVTTGYFEAMQIPLQAGRAFAEPDASVSPRVCIISAALASRFFPNQNPVGRLILTGGPDAPPSTIAGVVGDVRQAGLDASPSPAIYHLSARASGYFVVRAQDPVLLIPTVRSAIRQIDPEAAVEVAGAAQDIVAGSISQARLAMLSMTVFAGFALALALIGIYGVISYAVTQASREIGIRMTLGAQRRDILKLFLRYGAVLMLAGLAIGILGALAASRLLQSQLYAVHPTDPLTYAAVSLLLLTAGLLACIIPASRAMASKL